MLIELQCIDSYLLFNYNQFLSFMKKKVIFAGITLIAIVGAFVYGIQSNDDRVLSKYSGRELFLAIYFGSGEAVKSISSLEGMTSVSEAHQTTEVARANNVQFANEILALIDSENPHYFQEFKDGLASANYYDVENTLKEGSKVIKAAGYRSKYAPLFALAEEFAQDKVGGHTKFVGAGDLAKLSEFEDLRNHFKQKYGMEIGGLFSNFGLEFDLTSGIINQSTPTMTPVVEAKSGIYLQAAGDQKFDLLVVELSRLI